MKYILFIIFSFLTHICFSQIQRIDSIPREGIVLNEGWKFQAGDDKDWARPGFDDSKWQTINPTLDVSKIPQIRQQPIGWLRIKFHIDSSLLNKPLAYHVVQSIASQIYLNGTLIQTYGVVSADKSKIQEWWPSNDLRSIIFTQTEQTMAVRFSLQQALSATNFVEFSGFIFRISAIDNAVKNAGIPHQYPYQFAIYIGFYFVLSLLHFILYLNRPAKKANLYFSLTSLCGLFSSVLAFIFCTAGISLFYLNLLQISYYIFFTSLYNLFLYFAIHHLFSAKRNVMYWLIIAFAIANPVLVNITDNLLLLCMS